MEDKIAILKKWIDESNNIVFFGGAGVSTESGIPDFRSKDGLYNQHYKFPPEEILEALLYAQLNRADEIMEKRMKIWNTYNEELEPLEKQGKLKAIVTQNIDGLHQKAGSKIVYELHGSVLRNYCFKCGLEYPGEYVFKCHGIPKCSCSGIIKPDVVLYEEPLDENIIVKSLEATQKADMLIVAGTSLTVHPACDLINYYIGNKLVLINKDNTPYDAKANLVINESLGNVFSKIL